jgi:hypothetical protein
MVAVATSAWRPSQGTGGGNELNAVTTSASQALLLPGHPMGSASTAAQMVGDDLLDDRAPAVAAAASGTGRGRRGPLGSDRLHRPGAVAEDAADPALPGSRTGPSGLGDPSTL